MERHIDIGTLPKGPFNKQELMEICYTDTLDRIEDAVNMRQSILVECDKQLTIPIYQALRARKKREGKDKVFIDPGNPSVGGDAGNSNEGRGVLSIVSRLESLLMDSDVSDKVIILHHLDLMALGSDSLLDQMARNMTYLLHLNPLAVFVAFKDPEIPLPESLVRFFSMSTSIFGIERRHLYKIITAEEAKRFGETRIDIYDLYKRFSGLNALQIRQLLERIVGMKIPHFPMGEEEVRQELRRRTLSASYMELPDITFDDIGGCGEIIEKLEQDILRFVDMLKNPGESDDDDSMDAIRNIEKRIPRHILFEGPPGTGKTLLAKALANRLNAAVIVVNGPEIIGKWLGESEGKLREVFSKARKSAPSVIIFDEIDSIGGRRSEGEDAGGAGSAMNRLVNQLLTEMDGFRNEELVFVIGTTNHSSLLDPALMSRVQKIFHIPYPNDKGRREIFQIFNKKLDLKLSEEKLKFLVGKTEAWINPNNWRKFGGREIGALCSAIDRKTYDAERRDISLHELNDLVEEQIEVHFPKIRFQDIGGYQEVKRQLQEDILSMMKLAQEFGDNPSKLKVVEEAIPRGVIFEGPSGTGKTMFAMALANALDASIIVINASELKSSLYGDSEKKVHTLFEEARRNSPAVIVFDEMDALMGNRQGQDSSPAGGGSVDSSLVNQLLTEMDGLKTKDMVFVIGTTNLASVLDPAFKRPSRFSRIVHIPYPSEDDRRPILEIYNDKYKLGFTDKVYEVILEETENWIDADKYIRFSGDHLRYICQAVQRTRLKEGTKKSEKGDLKYIRSFIKGMIKVPFEPVDLDKDIGGYDDVKSALHEDILDMLLLARSRKDNPDQFFQIKNSIPKGVVFYGPPGTGKTLFARALATALKASIRVVNGPELKSAWQGETERMIREIFEQARRYSPAVIVFDEFDSLAGDRRSASGGERSIVNQILTEMDGLNENNLVFTVATTNHPDILDEAMKRPGRFEFQIEIPYPHEVERRAIFDIYNKKYRLNLAESVLKYLVFRTEMVVDIASGRRFSGDHIEAICRSIMREKYRHQDLKITTAFLDKTVRGRTNQPESISSEEKKIVAVHEAGHAIVGTFHKKGIPPKRISIVSELAGALGYVWHGDPKNRFVQTKDTLKGQICQLLGGRASERLVLGIQSSGCTNDLQEATRLATLMVTSLGMDENIGPRCMPEAELQVAGGGGVSVRKTTSHPELIKMVDSGINRILRECEEKTDRILNEHRNELDKLIKRLLKEETIDYMTSRN